MSAHIERRGFIALLGGATAAWPLAARAQQTAMPVVAYLSVGVPPAHLLAVFKQALAEAGFVEGRNVAIETPSADGHYDRLPALAADLVRRQVAVIVAITANPALAAKEATATIPVVFNVPEDPVELGLVASLARPGGNATGVSFLFSDLVAKHLGLLRELLPRATRIGLVNPQNTTADTLTKNATAAAASTGTEIIVFRAGDAGAIEDAFTTLTRQRADALIVGADGYFFRRRVQFATLVARHGLPTIFTAREFAEAGGLVPVWHGLYRDAYSLEMLTQQAWRGHVRGLWAALRATSRLAHAGCKAGDLEVTAFNGRLFSPRHAPLIEQRRVPDMVAAEVLLALATQATAGRPRRALVKLSQSPSSRG